MKNYTRLISSLSPALLLLLSMQVSAGPAGAGGFVNALTEEGQCGHEGAGKLQYLHNPDQINGYEVTVKTTEMHDGIETTTLKTLSIKAGGKKHLGCTLSEIMPLTSYTLEIVSETKSP